MLACLVEVAPEIFPHRAVGETGQLGIEIPGVIESHHLQPFRGHGEVEPHCLRADQSDPFHNLEALVEELFVWYYFVDQADAECLTGIDMVAGEPVE